MQHASCVPTRSAGTLLLILGMTACGGDTPTMPSSAGVHVTTPASAAAAVTIDSVVTKGAKPREPTGFADIGETIAVSAAVRSADVPVSNLTFSWSASAGTFRGSGPQVTWTAPTEFATPATIALTLKVTDGTKRPAAEKTVELRLHDSIKEVSDLAYDFMDTFSRQLDPAYVTRNFSAACREAANERQDTACEQQETTMVSYLLGTPQTTVPFAGTCPFVGRAPTGDACSLVPAEWRSTVKRASCHPDMAAHVGRLMVVTGADQVTAVLENDQWKLCASDWDQTSVRFLPPGASAVVSTLFWRGRLDLVSLLPFGRRALQASARGGYPRARNRA